MIANRYMIVTTLGSGGMADVFLAIDTILNREVAVKVLRGDASKDPVALLRFQREASAVSKLHHPNVVEVYDIGEFDGKNYIVMEYIRGKTLKQLIRQRGALSKEEAVSIMKQLVSAVAHAHENNIIHRDIKPQNILVKDDGTVKITDFGIALAHDAVQLTQSDSVLGSAHYIAPETTRGESATVQIDIYALGIVFYELLTGNVPFTGDNPVQIAMKHMREEIPSVREFNHTIPQSVENIIIRATAKNRLFRYESAKDMLFDLDMCLMSEFAHVEKVVFREDDSNDGTLVFDQPVKGTLKNTNSDVANEAGGKKAKKTHRIIAVVSIVLLLLVGGTLGVYFSGIIDGFGPVEYVKVPNLEGLSQEDATTLLAEYGLELNSNVDSEITDNIADGLIVSQEPAAQERVVEGTKVKITVSSGNYFVVEDYVNRNISEVESMLQEHNIDVITEDSMTSTVEVGTILEQSLLNAGEKLEPGVSRQIKFVIAKAPNFQMDNFQGAKVETAKNALEAKGAIVNIVQEEVPEGLEEYESGVVNRQTPEAGSWYTQTGDNVITLYYY